MSDIAGIAAKIASSGILDSEDNRLIQQSRGQLKDHAKIEKAAHDFESVLLGHWLEQAQQSFATVPGADPDQDEDADPGHDQFQGLAMQALASSLTKAGGIGIAKMIVRQLERSAATGAAEPRNPVPAGQDLPGQD